MNRKQSFLATVSTVGITVVLKDCSYLNKYVCAQVYFNYVSGYSTTIFYVHCLLTL